MKPALIELVHVNCTCMLGFGGRGEGVISRPFQGHFRAISTWFRGSFGAVSEPFPSGRSMTLGHQAKHFFASNWIEMGLD